MSILYLSEESLSSSVLMHCSSVRRQHSHPPGEGRWGKVREVKHFPLWLFYMERHLGMDFSPGLSLQQCNELARTQTGDKALLLHSFSRLWKANLWHHKVKGESNSMCSCAFCCPNSIWGWLQEKLVPRVKCSGAQRGCKALVHGKEDQLASLPGHWAASAGNSSSQTEEYSVCR